MDIDKLMKINNLSKELQRHGMAMSSIDAMEQARVAVEESVEGADTNNGLVMMPAKAIPSQEAPRQTPLQERRAELLLEMNNRKYDQELTSIKAIVSDLAEQVEQLRLEVKTLNERQFIAGTPKKVEKQEQLKPEQKIDHPRQGQYTPADVAIDKVFYFGTGGPKI